MVTQRANLCAAQSNLDLLIMSKLNRLTQTILPLLTLVKTCDSKLSLEIIQKPHIQAQLIVLHLFFCMIGIYDANS
uniref:Ovule protein n=1 Tax=Romanomermis culicivorax TaxID=13658 RepID=A0A915KIL6_ROMCU